MNGFKTYRFKDKDPVIDLLRTGIQDIASANGTKFNTEMANISEAIGRERNASMLRAWFYGDTTRPQYASVQAVAIAIIEELRGFSIDNKVVQLPSRSRSKTHGRMAA